MLEKKAFAKCFLWIAFLMPAYAEEPWIIDPHTHFKGEEQIALESKSVKRNPNDTLGKVVKPEDYRAIADRLEIQATLVVEAIEKDQTPFNEWILKQTTSDLICGYVARADLSSEDFPELHDRYKQTGYLNGYRFRFEELTNYLSDETAQQNLRRIESDGMVVDLLVSPSQSSDVIRLARDYPKLTIVINHCFQAQIKNGKVDPKWIDAVTDCAAFSNVFMKVSSILNFAGTNPFVETAPTDLEFYLPVLDHCYSEFGEDRVIFATNWGVSTHFGKVDDVVRIADEFFCSKGGTARKKGMRENAIRVYGISVDRLR